MGRPDPLFASDKNAAAIFDMKTAEFRSLVDGGQQPGPRMIGKFPRWDVEELRKIARGEFAESGAMDW